MASFSRPPPDCENMVSLKVDNLSYRTRPDDLERLFSKYGRVGDVYIPRDRFTKESRGFAFVRFFEKRDAEDAMDDLHGAIFEDRELRVQEAKYGRPSRPPPYRGGGGGYGGDRGYGDRSHNDRSSGRSSRRRSRSRSRSPKRRHRSYSRSRSRSPKRSPRRSRSRSNSRTPPRNSSPARRSGSRSKSRSPEKNRSPSPAKSRSRSPSE